MREDMYEIIIERPRRGSRWMDYPRRAQRVDPKVAARRDPDSLVANLGMKRGAKAARLCKSLNENLTPLRRYLERQVNRPWDKVWSEISAHLESGNTVQQHVRDHVEDFVSFRTFERDGTIYLVGRSGRPWKLTDGFDRLYVDPRTGILRKNKHYRNWAKIGRDRTIAAEKHRATRMRELGPMRQALRLDDNCWWEVRLAAIPMRTVTTSSRRFGPWQYTVEGEFRDVVRAAKLSTLPRIDLYGREGVYAVSKRQLSKKEIAALNLKEPRPIIPQPAR